MADDATRVNVLLVDDEPANLLALEAVLGDLGPNLVRATSGEEALQHLLETDFAAVLLDVRMPTLSGFETAERIRACPRSRATPILFLTAAEGGGFSAERAYALGAVDYLTKPLVPVALRAKVAVFVDLYQKTEALRAAERELVEARFRFLLDSLPALVSYVGPDHRYAFVNRAYETWFGHPRAAVVGRAVREVLGEAAWAAVGPRLDRALAGEVVTYEGELAYKDGGPRRVHVAYTPDRDPAGGVRGVVVLVTDVTSRWRAEEALRASEEEFRTTFERAGVGKGHTDPVTGRIVRVNPALCELLGYSSPELLARTISDITHPDDRGESEERFRALVRGEVPQYAIEKRYVRKDGAVIWVRVTATVVRAPDGHPVRACAIIEDITARKRAEAALAEESRRKDEFLATLAHELRNPLAPICNGLALLRMAPAGAPASERVLDMVERQLAHMVRLIDDLLDVSRVSRGRLELRRQRVTVRAVLDAALEASRPLAEAARHELVVRLPDEPLTLDADPVRLAQVVSNLLNNATKYTSPGGRITVTAERAGAEAVVRVADTGAGIEAEQLSEVFEMFNQVGKTLDRSQGGLGIGLALVRRLVEMHGGTVAAESPGVGQGSTFTVRLPLA